MAQTYATKIIQNSSCKQSRIIHIRIVTQKQQSNFTSVRQERSLLCHNGVLPIFRTGVSEFQNSVKQTIKQKVKSTL
jgi:LytS/YehU family sensor histidine kinase